jgi:hypothetical protein
MVGVYAETMDSFREKVRPGTADVILKAHVIDEALFRTIEASDSPTIVTWRDPRDVAVSTAQRTGQQVLGPVPFVRRSAACILSLMQTKRSNILFLDYATDYMNRKQTIREIAECLQIRAPASLVEELHKSLKTDTLRKSLTTWANTLESDATFNTHVDMNTHWHKNHIGDGKSDKWRTISGEDAYLLDACLGGQAEMFSGGREIRLPWNNQSSGQYEHRAVEGLQSVTSHSSRAAMHLPRGWWVAEFEATSPSPTNRVFEISIYCNEKLLSQRLMAFGADLTAAIKLMFEHRNPTETIFIRCSGLDDIDEMPISIPMIQFRQISALTEAEIGHSARRVSKQVTPAI